MANRLADYKFVDFQGNILDSPERIGNFLAEWGQKYATEFPGKNPYDYGFGPQKMVTTTNSVGGLVPTKSTKLGDDPRWSNPAQLLAMNFFSNPDAAKLLGDPAAVRQIVSDPGVYKLLQDNINGQAADMRSRDSGNIFSKAFNNLSTFASLATGMSGLVGGLGALASGSGLTGAAKAGISAVKDLGTNLSNSFFPSGSNALSSLAGNAVPGIRTGVTTPAGGAAIVGTGQAAPLTGIMGGAPLGASPLAVAGGAAAANIFPNFPELGKVQPLPSGRIPGTNTTVGEGAGNAGSNVLSNLKQAGDLVTSLSGSGMPVSTGNLDPLAFSAGGGGGDAATALALGSGVGTGTGTGSGAPANFFPEIARTLGDQAGVSGKTRPGAYFNVLQALQPRYAAGYS